MAIDITLPELGENITQGDVVKILVQVGDIIEKDQPLLELETDKASFDVPSPEAGKIASIHVEEGGKAVVGEVIMKLEDSDGDAEAVPTRKTEESEQRSEETAHAPEQDQATDSSVPADSGDEAQSDAPATGSDVRQTTESQPQLHTEAAITQSTHESVPVPAAPSVRMFAREIGIDIDEVRGSGPNGRISIDDVKSHAKALLADTRDDTTTSPRLWPALPDFTAYGGVRREGMSKVRRKTAEHMELSGSLPVVTQHDRADITHLEEIRQRFSKKAETAGVKLTVTAIVLKVVAVALKKFPQFNASIDMERNEIIYKNSIHLGVAVDTDRGLLVPVIRDADKKNIFEISREVQEAAEKARSKNIRPDDMSGASFTITNLGGIGGTAFTPIINWPEVAILGLARASMQPVHIAGEFQARFMLPLSLTYDHRLIDGADAARFLRWVAEALEEPVLLALEG